MTNSDGRASPTKAPRFLTSMAMCVVLVGLIACASREPELATRMQALHAQLFGRVESWPGDMLDPPSIAFYMLEGANRAHVDDVICSELPRLAAELGVDADIEVGVYERDGARPPDAWWPSCLME